MLNVVQILLGVEQKEWVPQELRLPVKHIKVIFIQGIKVGPKVSVFLAGGIRIGSVCDSISTYINMNSICVGFLDPTIPTIDNRLNGPLYRILRTCLRKSQLWTTLLCSRIVLRPKPTVPKCSKGKKARRRCLTKLTVPKACFEKD